MASPATDLFLTPNAASLTLRAVRDPAIETTVRRGDPLLVIGWPGGGFVEVDHAGESWFALQRDLSPWSGAASEGIALEPAMEAVVPPPVSNPPALEPWSAAPITPQPAPAALPLNRAALRAHRPPPQAVIAGAVVALLGAVLLLAAGLWKYPLGWVMCDGFAHIESIERVGGETLVLCSGGHPLRAPFRKYGDSLPSQPAPARYLWSPSASAALAEGRPE